MHFIPFPEPYAAESAARARAAYAAECEAAKRGKKPRVGDSHINRDVAAYRQPDGRVTPCYDPYRPQYPAGSVPGLADVTYVREWYPNDSEGYRAYAANFRALSLTP